ncbi:hypothetical protein TcWFU_008995 [Taenia crassiceps]|uniref:Uncharacterized protein n=1 Tax=Taenia crassiceps TaxID=6207 RepID=A0ABR4QC04_9CEST
MLVTTDEENAVSPILFATALQKTCRLWKGSCPIIQTTKPPNERTNEEAQLVIATVNCCTDLTER